MNFWTYLDRNGSGIAMVLVILACLAMPTIHEKVTGHRADEGCRIRCGSSDQAPSQPEKQ